VERRQGHNLESLSERSCHSLVTEHLRCMQLADKLLLKEMQGKRCGHLIVAWYPQSGCRLAVIAVSDSLAHDVSAYPLIGGIYEIAINISYIHTLDQFFSDRSRSKRFTLVLTVTLKPSEELGLT
jgi:hypothetical protein